MSKRDCSTGKLSTAGKTVEHCGEGALPCFFFENSRRVGVGLARMNDQRQAGFAGCRDFAAKSTLLRFAR